MFLLPLALREKLSLICLEDIVNVQTLIQDDVLCILLYSNTYIELIQIPLNGEKEYYEKKAIFPISACLCLNGGKMNVYALSKQGVHIFHNHLEEHVLIGMALDEGTIKSIDNEVIVFTRNKFYRIEEGRMHNLRISPYFSSIVSFDLIRGYDGTSCIVYKTHKYLYIYTVFGREVISKFPIKRRTFVDGENLFVEDKKDLVLFKVTKNGLEQKKKIHLNLEGIQNVWYSNNSLKISGSGGDGYFFYYNEILYALNSLVLSVAEYKGVLFCVSVEMIYFVPKDKDADLKLSGCEYVALHNILENKFSPFVTRTFDYNEEILAHVIKEKDIEEIDFRRPLVKTTLKDKVVYLPELEKPVNGIFLSLLVSQGVQIQIRKLICNGLKHIKKTGLGRDYLKMLETFTKLNHKIYRVFSTLKLDFTRLWVNFTSILELKEINLNLLLKCLSIDFHPVDLQWTGSQRDFYEVIKGIERYKKRICDNIKIPEILDYASSENIVTYFYEIFELNEDVLQIFYLYKQTGYKPSPRFLGILKERNDSFSNYNDEGSEFIKFIECFLKEEKDYEWFVWFLGEDYSLVEYSCRYSRYILRDCLKRPSLALKGLDYFYRGRDSKGVAKTLFGILKSGGRPHSKYFDLVGDYVFVGDNKFIGIEYLQNMRGR